MCQLSPLSLPQFLFFVNEDYFIISTTLRTLCGPRIGSAYLCQLLLAMLVVTILKIKWGGWGIWLQGQKCWFQSSWPQCWNISLNIQKVSDIFILPFSRDLSLVSGGWNCSRWPYAQQPMGKKDSTCASQGFNPVHPLAPALWQVQIPDRAGMAVVSVTDIWTTVLCFQGVVLCSCQIVLKRIFLNLLLK